MQPLSHWADDLLACGDVLPEELRVRIVSRGEGARETLLKIATDPLYRGDASPGEPFAPFHALEMLADLPPDAATAASLVKSIVADPDSEEADATVDVLVVMGETASAPLVSGMAAAPDALTASWMAIALAQGGYRSDAVFDALLAAFERFPGDIAGAIGIYGDDRALPALRRAFDAHTVKAGGSIELEDGFLDIAEAIEKLGGELDVDSVAKVAKSAARRERLYQRTIGRNEPLDIDDGWAPPAAAPRLPGPNDPCPCGSGRKFKKCHEGDAAFARPPLDPVVEDEDAEPESWDVP